MLALPSGNKMVRKTSLRSLSYSRIRCLLVRWCGGESISILRRHVIFDDGTIPAQHRCLSRKCCCPPLQTCGSRFRMPLRTGVAGSQACSAHAGGAQECGLTCCVAVEDWAGLAAPDLHPAWPSDLWTPAGLLAAQCRAKEAPAVVPPCKSTGNVRFLAVPHSLQCSA